MGGKHHPKCLSCGAKSDNSRELYFFKVPEDKYRREIWLHNLKRPDLIGLKIGCDWKVCSDHFENDMFGRNSQNKVMLKRNAIPFQLKPSKRITVIEELVIFPKILGANDKFTQPKKIENVQVNTSAVENVQVNTPTVESVQVNTPAVETVQVNTPTVESVHVNTPTVESVHVNTPTVESVQVHTPTVESVQVNTPTVKNLQVYTPTLESVQVNTPAVDTIIENVLDIPRVQQKIEIIEIVPRFPIIVDFGIAGTGNIKDFKEVKDDAPNVSNIRQECQPSFSGIRNTTEKETQTEKIKGNVRKRRLQKLKEQYKLLKEENERLNILVGNHNNFILQAKHLLPPELARIVQNHIENYLNKWRGCRFTESYKKLALGIYFIAPAAYHFLARNLNLPPLPSLHKFIKNWSSGPGIHDVLFNALKIKIQNLPDEAKNCVICIDQISLKPNLFFEKSQSYVVGLEDNGERKTNLPAKYAVVIMVQGITHQYKHLVGYSFVNSSCPAKDLKYMIGICTRKLIALEMKPRLVISDQGRNFIKLNKLLSVSPKRPYFTMCNCKIYYMYDSADLLKSFRNNFKKYNIRFKSNRVASWKDIKQFYHVDKNRLFKIAPKLTNEHIYPEQFQNTRVKSAAQVISSTVAAGIYAYINRNSFSPTAINTAELISKFDNLFDIFNSSKYKEAKTLRRPFCANKEQIDYLNDMELFISSMRLISFEKDVTKTVTFLDGWVQNINVLKNLHTDLKSKQIPYIFTRNLNQDALKNMFCSLRKRGKNKGKLTPYLFSCAFKKLFSEKYMEHIPSKNYQPTQSIQLPIINAGNITEPSSPSKPISFKVHFHFNPMNLAEKNAFFYFGEWLFRENILEHNCQEELSSLNSILATFINSQQYYKVNLIAPPAHFMQSLKRIESKFINNFSEIIVQKDIEKKLLDILRPEYTYVCCDNQNIDFIVGLYIRVRMYYVIKNYNKNVKESDNKIHC